MKKEVVTERKFDKILDKAVLTLLILQIGFILYMNLFRADTIIDYDSSSVYMHEIEMGSQGKIFPSQYSYQSSLDLDSGALVSAFLYHFLGNIFLARGITNNLMVLLYIYVVSCVLGNMGISKRWKRFGILLFFIPYSMIMLGYWRMLFTGGGFFALRALVPILIISLILDMEKGKAFREYAFRAVLLMFIVFLSGLSSGAYVLLSAVCPLFLWEIISAFLKGDYRQIRSKRMAVFTAAVLASAAGFILQKAMALSTIADTRYILTSNKWVDALVAAFAGLFELFGGLTIHEQVNLFSLDALGTAVDHVVTWILIFSIIYTVAACIKKREISDMKGYILSLMLVNAMMCSFVDLKYGETVYESRYHLVPMLPSFFLVAMMMEELSKNIKLKRLQTDTLQVLVIGIFAASMLFGDAQWVYAKTALETDKLKELNRIMETEEVQTAFIVGDDNKVLGRKLRVYGKSTHYIVVSDGAESARQTTFGGTSRYLDNLMQQGKTAVIASPGAFETLPSYLRADMEYLRDYDGLVIYTADESRFDCEGGIVPEKNEVVDFAYSPGYTFENAAIDDDGTLVMKEGGGKLESTYSSAEGVWEYTIYYDMPDAGEDAFAGITAGDGAYVEIKVEDQAPLRTVLNPASDFVKSSDIVMTDGKRVDFVIQAPEGAGIKKIVISRKG